jgi:hypothetical protein
MSKCIGKWRKRWQDEISSLLKPTLHVIAANHINQSMDLLIISSKNISIMSTHCLLLIFSISFKEETKATSE